MWQIWDFQRAIPMTPIPPLPRDQRKIDADHLKLLSVFHFVAVGLAVLGLLFLLAHYTMFHAFFSNPKIWQNQKQPPIPVEFFAIIKWFYLIMGTWFVASAVLNLFSGLFIRSRKHRTFSMIVGGVNCLHVPVGTALGVFTMVVLIRDSVRELYES